MPAHRVPPVRRLSPQAVAIALTIVTFAFGVVVGLWKGDVADGRQQPLGLTLFIAAGVVLLAPAVLAATLMYWRRLDEAAQEAHKWAWYWGGGLGVIPAVLLSLTDQAGVDLAGRLGFVGPSALINFGVLSVLVCMLAGYGLAWGFWWLRRR